MYDLLIKNGLCVGPETSLKANLAVQGGKIAAVDVPPDAPAKKVIDAAGKLVLPGVLDTHVHLPWPSASFDSTDDFGSGSLGAVHGGVTTLIEYVVSDDSGHLLKSLEQQLARAQKTAFCDFSFHVILRKITPETLAEMAEAVSMGFTSFKIFTAYTGFRMEDADVITCLRRGKELGALICFHAEDGVLVSDSSTQLAQTGRQQIENYPLAHPRLADIEATSRVLNYARYTGARIHIVHVNTAEGAGFIAEAKKNGVRVTGETCPHYLVFTDDCYKTRTPQAANFILSPCIREDYDRAALWEALSGGGLETLATDHCPYSITQKTRGGDDFRTVPGGAGGVETSLPLMYTNGVCSGKLSLNRMVEVMCANPAKIFNLYPRKGVLAAGSDADIVIYNPEGQSTVHAQDLHCNMDHTIYEGIAVKGAVETTILRGGVVVENGKLAVEGPGGEILRRPAYTA